MKGAPIPGVTAAVKTKMAVRMSPRKSDRHLGDEFDDAIGGNREEVGRIRRLPRQGDKKPVPPRGHAPISRGPAAEKERCRHNDGVIMPNFKPA
jgi:hypothetical protein